MSFTKRNILRFIIGLIVLIIFSYSVFLFLRNVETTLYLGISNPSESIDMVVKIDNNEVYRDTITYFPNKFELVTKQLQGGFHKLYVYSKMENLIKERTVLLLFDQHIIIEYFPQDDKDNEQSYFSIRNQLLPFYPD